MKVLVHFIVLVLLLLQAQLIFPAEQSLAEPPASSDHGMRDLTTATNVEGSVYSNKSFLELVRKYAIDDGEKVDYESWKNSPEDLAALDRQVALIARISPVNRPELFPTRAAQRSYWINTYNTLVLRAVLAYWPLASVRDVKISVSSRIIPGKGFFYDRKIVVGGEETSLYKLEKEVLRSQKDPRLHFALNCGSESCPVLRPWEWTDEQLDEAARAFINKPENVSIEDRVLYLSSIFKWYKKDFPKNIHGYLQQYSKAELNQQLQLAKDENFRIRYRTYDWSLNGPEKKESSGGGSH